MGSVATIDCVQIRAALMAMCGTTLLSSVFVCISNAILKMDFFKGNDNADDEMGQSAAVASADVCCVRYVCKSHIHSHQ